MHTALRSALAASLLLLASAVPALSATWAAFSQQAFDRAQAQGQTIVVDVYADWCPTCKVQEPILEELASNPLLEEALLLRVDFDIEKDFLAEHRIPRQSTVVVFTGGEEVSRSIAETNRERLRAAVLRGLVEDTGTIE
ncbi:MAG: thioredoxin family protein [Parvibaculum sp.]|jgi:thiol:disulfide interchange protein|uniref:thioredoxin family protein n=1 Tax=Parvibaculum sp. TaxID=2024848 RepID=UPI002ABC74DE|nr:thioredoxin family protein [Parvibaculum sp.]MDZ4381765.1 thioredoxin family protein [Parvibaculum sp.]